MDFYQGPNAKKGIHWFMPENGFEKAKKACDKDFECEGFVRMCDDGPYYLCEGKLSDSLKHFKSKPQSLKSCDLPFLQYQKG